MKGIIAGADGPHEVKYHSACKSTFASIDTENKVFTSF